MNEMKRIRQSFYKMGVDAKQALIEACTELGQKAIQYAFNQGYMGSLSPRKYFIGYTNEGKPLWNWIEPKPSKTGWYSRTGALHDSFGSAVYVDGVLQKDTIRFVDDSTWRNERNNRWNGRRELLEYFHRIKPRSKKNEVSIVVIAAVPYALFLEKGTHAGRYKIRVISGARQYIDAHWHEIESKVYKKIGLKKPDARVIKGNMYELKGVTDVEN